MFVCVGAESLELRIRRVCLQLDCPITISWTLSRYMLYKGRYVLWSIWTLLARHEWARGQQRTLACTSACVLQVQPQNVAQLEFTGFVQRGLLHLSCLRSIFKWTDLWLFDGYINPLSPLSPLSLSSLSLPVHLDNLSSYLFHFISVCCALKFLQLPLLLLLL